MASRFAGPTVPPASTRSTIFAVCHRPEARTLREEIARNPLTVLPDSTGDGRPLTALDAELVGNYAVRIRFSDGHDTGLYSWDYLRRIDPDRSEAEAPR